MLLSKNCVFILFWKLATIFLPCDMETGDHFPAQRKPLQNWSLIFIMEQGRCFPAGAADCCKRPFVTSRKYSTTCNLSATSMLRQSNVAHIQKIQTSTARKNHSSGKNLYICIRFLSSFGDVGLVPQGCPKNQQRKMKNNGLSVFTWCWNPCPSPTMSYSLEIFLTHTFLSYTGAKQHQTTPLYSEAVRYPTSDK